MQRQPFGDQEQTDAAVTNHSPEHVVWDILIVWFSMWKERCPLLGQCCL